ncbi:MAG TPA: hypothetical protein V6D25_08355 [Leptolyngbyaceae cyanobacterium]
MNKPESSNKNTRANLQALAEKLVEQAMDIEIKCCTQDFDVTNIEIALHEIETIINSLKDEIKANTSS